MELEPCPFCNEIANCYRCIGFFCEAYFYVKCIRCEAVTKQFPTPESAIAAWNRRAEPPNEPLTLDELREMNRRPIWVQFLDSADADKCGWEICKYYMYDWNLYGKLWVAYRQRPGEIREPE